MEVADGGGPTSWSDNGLFNDKEWITTDNNPARRSTAGPI